MVKPFIINLAQLHKMPPPKFVNVPTRVHALFYSDEKLQPSIRLHYFTANIIIEKRINGVLFNRLTTSPLRVRSAKVFTSLSYDFKINIFWWRRVKFENLDRYSNLGVRKSRKSTQRLFSKKNKPGACTVLLILGNATNANL